MLTLRINVINFLKRCRLFLAIMIIALALFVSLIRALTPWISQYKPQIETQLSHLLGEPIHIGSIQTGWYWFLPVIQFNQVTLTDATHRLLTLSQLKVGIDLISSLRHWQLRPGLIELDDVHLVLRQTDKGFQLEGLSYGEDTGAMLSMDSINAFLTALLAQKKIVIKRCDVALTLKNGEQLSFHDVNIMVAKNQSYHRLKWQFSYDNAPVSGFANVAMNAASLIDSEGAFYVSVKHAPLAKWQRYWPTLPFQLSTGKGEVEAWFNVKDQHITNVTLRLNLQKLHTIINKVALSITAIKGNIAFIPSTTGFTLNANHFELVVNETQWPVNEFSWTYQSITKANQLAIKQMDVALLMKILKRFLPLNQTLLQLAPHGTLKNGVFRWHQQTLDYALFRFEQWGWQSVGNIPALDKVSGALMWQPTLGHVQLKSTQTVLRVKGQPQKILNSIDGELQWQRLSTGMRYDLLGLTIKAPDLIGYAEGSLKGKDTQSPGRVNGLFTLNAMSVQQWLALLPQGFIKPELAHWLTHGIKTVGSLNAKGVVRGNLAEFPFDKGQGDFYIDGDITDMSLYFIKDWPLTRQIAAHFSYNSRILTATISKALLQSIAVNQIEVKARQLGTSKESLLIQGKVETDAKSLQQYFKASPLPRQLPFLTSIQFNGPLSLDLGLTIPLYQTKEAILLSGNLKVKHNHWLIKDNLITLPLNEVNGFLTFTHQGILESQLSLRLIDTPLKVQIVSKKQQPNGVLVAFQGRFSVAQLKKQWSSPLWSKMRGLFDFNGHLNLLSPHNQLDKLILTTSLKGLSSDWPYPFHKTSIEKIPLQAILDFKPAHAIKLLIDYNAMLKASVLLSRPVQTEGLKKKGGNKTLSLLPGGKLEGTLASLNISAWQKALANNQSAHLTLDGLRGLDSLDLSIELLKMNVLHFENCALKINRMDGNRFAIEVKQSQIEGKLIYQQKPFQITGQLTRLFIPGLLDNLEPPPSWWTSLKAQQLPELNMKIDDFRYGDRQFGDVMIDAHQQKRQWVIEKLTMTSPFLLIQLTGFWQQQLNLSKTFVEVSAHIKKLGKVLDNLKLPPVVDALKGDVQFKGEWSDKLTSFSLSKLKGDVYMGFDNGRIKHFSEDTEDKLDVGRLFSLLSLQTIPRRLKLDFSDLFEDGFSFDKCEGYFNINAGLMHTSKTYIQGPVAYASLSGDIDLIQRLYDLKLRVSPYLTSSLPVVATIAGGPVAGMATWFVSKLINQGMQNINVYTYTIEGPWAAPKVTRVSSLNKQHFQLKKERGR